MGTVSTLPHVSAKHFPIVELYRRLRFSWLHSSMRSTIRTMRSEPRLSEEARSGPESGGLRVRCRKGAVQQERKLRNVYLAVSCKMLQEEQPRLSRVRRSRSRSGKKLGPRK
jgi:hypothetical protein